MGNKFSCLKFWGSKEGSRESNATTQSPPFDMSTALVKLAPNHVLGRVAEATPQCLLNGHWLLQLQSALPVHLQRRKLELVFSSWENGFSYASLKSIIADRRRGDSKEYLLLIRPSIVLSGGGNINDTKTEQDSVTQAQLIGAFIPGGIDFSQKKYYGLDSTFVFTSFLFAPTSSTTTSPTGSKQYGTSPTSETTAKTNDNYSHSPSSPSAARQSDLTIFPCAIPKCNEYFVRTADGVVTIGGGGKGPAITFDEDMENVKSSTLCPTFDCRCLLPTEAKGCGITMEGGVASAPMHTIELWTFSNSTFTLPQ